MDGLADRTQNVILETDRLRFATWMKEDWKEFQKIATDPLVVRYLGTGEPWPDERVQEFVARQCENWEKHRNLPVEAAAERQRYADRNLRPSTLAGRAGRGNRLVAGAFALGTGLGHGSSAPRVGLRFRGEQSRTDCGHRPGCQPGFSPGDGTESACALKGKRCIKESAWCSTPSSASSSTPSKGKGEERA